MDTNGTAQHLLHAAPELFARFDPNLCISLLDSVEPERPYHHIPDVVRNLWGDITNEYGERGFDAFQRVTLLRLIEQFDERIAAKEYTGEIVTRFGISHERILKSIENDSFEKYRTPTDVLLKDLAICRQHVFPAGAQIVEPNSAFHRSLLARGGFPQALRFIKLLFESGGNKPWYQIHTHLEELDEFNPDGWDRLYLRLAEMLEVNREIRGMWGGSWFYDPALTVISPRLSYLRTVPQDHGAYLFYSNVDINGGALSKSESRKLAYQRGEYIPKSYVLIWPRQKVIGWAEKARRMNPQ